jgi:PucR C-terminal helix-turn-helix domain/GGDEF-like domain
VPARPWPPSGAFVTVRSVHAHRNGVLLLAERAHRRLPAIVDDLMDRQLREVPEFFVTDDPAYRQAVRGSTHANSELMLEAMRRPGAIPRVLPPGPRLEADVAAQHGAPVWALLRTYRLGQQAMVEHLLDDLDSDGADGIRHSGAALRAATRTFFDYMETVMPLVASEYAAERARLEARPDLKRLRLVEAALAGDESVDLGYSVSGPHVAVVANDEHAEHAIAIAAHALGAACLSLRARDGRWWAWVATPELEEVRARLHGEGVAGPAGIGGPGDGAAGFRAAHRQALLAERIARGRRDGIVDLRSSAIEALALGGQRTAWEVAHAELGPLAGADAGAIRLRTTLEVWFTARERLADTAAALGVAPRTVSYRLRRAEGLMGSTIAERRAELEAALRVVRLFEGEPPPPGP